MSIIDARGRIGDRTVVTALGWGPGDPLRIRIVGDAVIISSCAESRYAVSRQGRVHLPAEVRQACAITAGDAVLLAADPDTGVLSVHPPARLDSLVFDATSAMLAGAA